MTRTRYRDPLLERNERWTWRLAALGLIVLFAAVAFFFAGCGGRAPAPRRVELVDRACLDVPPPAPPAGRVLFEACEPGWAACLDREAAVLLITYLANLRRYADDAWTNCATDPAPKEP